MEPLKRLHRLCFAAQDQHAPGASAAPGMAIPAPPLDESPEDDLAMAIRLSLEAAGESMPYVAVAAEEEGPPHGLAAEDIDRLLYAPEREWVDGEDAGAEVCSPRRT